MQPRSHPTGTRPTALLVAAVAILSTPTALAGRHPHLLISPDEVVRLKHACGVGTAPAGARGLGRFGERADDFNVLRTYFSQRLGDVVLPGELPAAAFLHLVAPDDAGEADRLAAINSVLTQPRMLTADGFETVLALDWCWDALEPAARREFLLHVRDTAKPLSPADSPLDHRVFRGKLAAVAVALAIDEADEPSPSWAEFRERILDAAQKYFASTLPQFIEVRGLIPTSPAAAAFEENDTALAIEFAGLLSGTNPWANYRDSVGRWMEHYILVETTHPALQHQFLRDDGSTAPMTPAARTESLLPLTAHLIAARTHDPAAAYVADRVTAKLRGPGVDPSAALWRWVPVLFGLHDVPRVDIGRLPGARNLGGAVVLRGGGGPSAATIWIDAGQPYLRRGQHFDAGHFLIRAGGYLAVAGGDDIEFEATHAKGGTQQLDQDRQTFDFAQYFSASIAHNCMVFWDAARVTRWYGQLYAPTGGQTPLEGTCTDFAALEQDNRQSSRLRAYGYERHAAYVALELTSAYDRRSLASYTREFVFLWGRVLVVIDRARTASPRITPTWVINVPDRPTVAGADLAPEAHVAGSANEAGIWRYDEASVLRWHDRDGVLWLHSVLPEPRHLAIVGGPARKELIPDGPHRGRSYVGGDPNGFEHLVLPASRPKPANAWYRLGKPTLLGPEFGIRPHWGRVEIEPAEPDETYLFVNTVVIDEAESRTPPDIRWQNTEGRIAVTISLGQSRAELVLSDAGSIGGELRLDAPERLRWVLPDDIMDDDALPLR
jgi:hypothetical protein